MKLIIAGSRKFNDIEVLTDKLDGLLSKCNKTITIISGGAYGADKCGEIYALNKGYKTDKFPAEWDKFGKKAGYIRNVEMAKAATHCVVFWDGKSKGSKHMIDTAKKYNLELRIIRI